MGNFFGTIFRHRPSRVWFIVTSVVLVLLLAVTIVASTALSELMNTLFGHGKRILGEGGGEKIFPADFETKAAARENGERVNEEICEEGFVLLKNESSTLPIATSAVAKARVSVFGKNSVNLVYGGSGSGAGSNEFIKTIFECLEAANFEYNKVLETFYKNTSQSGAGRSANPGMENGGAAYLNTGETPWESYTANNIPASYASDYKDAALVVFSRIGGEGFDLPRTGGHQSAHAQNTGDHYLQLDKHEAKLLEEADKSFDKVIVILNSSTPMQIGDLKDDARVDAVLWIGAPGDTGIMALGRILNGTVNPSGRLPDTYARNFKNDPTYVNFGSGSYTGDTNGPTSRIRMFVDYEEGIYVGYRYYETRYITEAAATRDTWYNNNVVYPFGYGLSYGTAFTQEFTGATPSTLSKNKFTVSVRVTNNGAKAGKDAVQIYMTSPYTSGGIEKSHVVLAGCAKTPEIAAGGNATIQVEIDPYYFASYDMNAANGSQKGCYVLEQGAYIFKLAKNAHAVGDNLYGSFTANVSAVIRYEDGETAGTKVFNRFDDAAVELVQKLSRADNFATMPQTRTPAETVMRKIVNDRINSFETNNTFTTTVMPVTGQKGGLMLQDFFDKDYDDKDWKTLLETLTVDEMVDLIGKGNFQTVAILSIGKPQTTDADGPAGFVNFMSVGKGAVYGTSHYVCEPVMAATFNTKLLEKLGIAVGNEALIGNEDGDGAPYSGWYAPGVNIHRSPFGGRVGEYFSEDPFLSGMMASYEIKGVMTKGVYTQVKHFAVNEQETARNGVCTWLTEQTLREIYLRPFEMTVKIGGTRAMMSSFNRIGAMWTGGDYRLLTDVLRSEWGFRGMVICDFNTGGHMDSRQMHYAGGDLNLQTQGINWSPRKSNATDITIVRDCSKNILYTVANSNAMNDEVVGYKMAGWQILLIVADIVVVLGLAAWGIFVILGAFKKAKSKTTNN